MSADEPAPRLPRSDERVLSSVATGKTRQFRTLLRVLAKGMHYDQAWRLLGMRARTRPRLELLADDVNT